MKNKNRTETDKLKQRFTQQIWLKEEILSLLL